MLAGVSGVYVIYLCYYVARYSIIFSFTIAGLSIAGIVIRMVCSNLIDKDLRGMTRASGELNRIFMDSITNITTVQKLRGISFIMNKTDDLCKKDLRSTGRYIVGNEIGFTLYKTLNFMVCPICMFIALELYNSGHSFPIQEFLTYISIVTVQLVHNVKNIAAFVKDYNMYSSSQKEIDRLVEDTSDTYTSTSFGRDFNLIELKNVSYQYTVSDEATTIYIKNLSVAKGDRICITGESGQGKTTMLKLLTGMIETKGNLFVDGKETGSNIDAVYIAQDTEMLDMTLRDNLTFGNKRITDNELIEMISRVGMEEWFSKQKDGLDTLLGERGVFVSTGQRQRLNLIRGLLIDKEIYLLDEPTSNVDDETENKMIQLIQEKLCNKTIVIVTHKDKICSICDKKYIFEGNELLEAKR